MSAPSEEGGFLSRWSRRKVQVQTGVVPPEPMPAPVEVPKAEVASPQALPLAAPTAPVAETPPAAAPLPTLEDVARLTRESDYSRFVAPGVDGGVRNAAMRKLFTDPHFNVMDGLDTYIDDYGKPDPIPDSMLRMMRQSSFLGLFDDEKKVASAAAAPDLAAVPAAPPTEAVATAEPEDPAHEDTDLRLQQDDAAGRPGPDQGSGP
jgi:Protein of unknown function (DUF3306)